MTSSPRDPRLEPKPVRAGLNQTERREANERIEAGHAGGAFAEFVCECVRETCDAAVYMTIEEYEAVRSGSARFVVAPGHTVEAERPVSVTPRFQVVEKVGAAATLAALLDRRALTSNE